MTAVAVLGTGHMGAPIARRLLATGHRVTVWNRTPSRTGEIPGAGVAASPADAARDAEVAIVMVTDAAAVDAVLFGRDGAAPALRPGTSVVQMSTIGPAEVREVARRLPPGVGLVDAPVAGSVGAAESGGLTVLAGGDEATIRRVAAVLEALGTVRRCGGVGDGAALKLVFNTALVTGLAALADTLAVARSVGVDRAAALDALAGSALGAAVNRVHSRGASFSLALAGKDVHLALGALGGVEAPVARAAARAMRAMPDQTADISELIREQP
jgi:3-hydroxyisobutyrate dehydrogenase-like beta-hydroxyacid dehydrogenase